MLKRLVGYASYMFGANLLTGMLTFAVNAMGMAERSKEAYGDYAFYQQIYGIGQGLFIFGANAAIQRFGADNEENRLRFGSIAFRLFGMLLVITGLFGVATGATTEWSYALALFALPWIVINWWARYIVRSRLDARREARLMMIASLSNSVFQFLFLRFTDYRDALIYGDALANVAGGIAGIAYIIGSSGKSIGELARRPVPPEFVRESIRFATPVWWSGQIFTAREQVGGLWTKARLGSETLASLGGMTTFWQFASKPLEYLGQAALPGLVEAKDDRSKLYREILRFCLVTFTFVGIAVASGIPLVFEIIDLVRGSGDEFAQKYAEIPLLLRILAVTTPIVAFETVTNQYSIAENRARAVLHSNVITVIAVAASLYPLTEAWGLLGVLISGAVIGRVASAATYAASMWRDYPNEMKSGARWTLLATLCAIAAMALPQHYASWKWSWTLSFLAVAIYLVALMLCRVLILEDFQRVIRALRKRG